MSFANPSLTRNPEGLTEHRPDSDLRQKVGAGGTARGDDPATQYYPGFNPRQGIVVMSREIRWNTRYQDAGDEYLFGTEPSRFLAHRAELLRNGRTALAVADGEGRNSVWLAEQGLEVTAVEISSVAVEKARRLAAGRQVAINFMQADMLAPGWPPPPMHAAFDWVIGIFIQFASAEERARQFAAMQQMACRGGRVLLQGYTPKQLEYGTGGPGILENLYTREILLDAFAGWEIEELVEYEDDISEGRGHKGRSALIGMVARKP